MLGMFVDALYIAVILCMLWDALHPGVIRCTLDAENKRNINIGKVASFNQQAQESWSSYVHG